MGQFKLVDQNEDKKVAEFIFEEASVEDVSAAVEELFLEKGYKLEKGTITNGTYGAGSRVMRAIFGAFVKRYVFGIKVEQMGSMTKVILDKASSGMMGGAIGYAKMNSEFKRWKTKLEDL